MASFCAVVCASREYGNAKVGILALLVVQHGRRQHALLVMAAMLASRKGQRLSPQRASGLSP
eukprot:13745481-Alexandrium_andersonii.AAC.1